MKSSDSAAAAIVVGGGASGMLCALRLARAGVGVLLLERNDRLGKKLSATGNGQGNITNQNMGAEHYFTSSKQTAEHVLAAFGKDELLAFLRACGGLFVTDEEGRVYPASRQAASVTDLLRAELSRCGAEVRLQEKVTGASYAGGCFRVHTEQGSYESDYLVLACGGKAAKHFGTDGGGYALAEAFGHTVTKLRPSLVQLKTEQTFIRGLKGVRADCALRLLRGGKEVARMRGDVLFADYGVSGDAVFRISAFAREGDELCIDFLPMFEGKELSAALSAKSALYPQLPPADLLRGMVNSSIGKCVAKYYANGKKAGDIGCNFGKLAHCVKNFRLPVTGTLGFDYAQVTKGGVPMGELTQELESKKVRGLYIVGELTDTDGECGGYNLQWAFSSGAAAASSILREVRHAD